MDKTKQHAQSDENAQRAEVIADRSARISVEASPNVYRLCGFNSRQDGAKTYYMADLYYDGRSIPVYWSGSRRNEALRENVLVRPYRMKQHADEAGRYEIGGIAALARPERDFCVFKSIPDAWNVPVELLNRMSCVVSQLPGDYRHLINSIFWNEGRLYRYCHAPASLRHHHAYRHGLLEHTLQVAEMVMRMCAAGWQSADRDLTLVGALLHDAGKADEYVYQGRAGWRMSDRGMLLGHGTTIVEWLAVSAAQPGLSVPETAMMALTHLLTARRGAPDWLGLRAPAMIESELLSHADRLSAESDLHQRLQHPAGGWGRKHHTMRQRVYTLPMDDRSRHC
ncbi:MULTISPECIES: HD domain-containing protein [unclassified Ectothiorhodospira]|uniref:HD domain-containing protein n=1 Tax=unclassified Ectothiorhodospira TaxID=2684909 RepID=UPI001EE97541|nr:MULTISPECIES: HD domain-containing protein [unclassified Ectothiorhodospira]MCG5517347.1 HD domain-containing protein [Ectothiorhodospira sp. 9100]MCG5519947.1 HD domain-containing protein [Ectothiorhodospira sp. 9905]